MDEVSRRAQVAGEIRIGKCGFEGSRSTTITILADQRVDASIFVKFLYAWGEDDQLRTLAFSPFISSLPISSFLV